MAISLDELYSDPDWMLQAGLGDIEFEQDMYDDIMYGDPSGELSDIERNRIEEGLWPELYDYDELALMGLRKHTMEGPLRYIPSEEQIAQREKGTLATADVDDPFDPSDDDEPIRIDINLPKILEEWDPKQGSLQSFISDVYRHEYKHPLWDQMLGEREYRKKWPWSEPKLDKDWTLHHFKEKYRRPAKDIHHLPIRATGALYDLNPQTARTDYEFLENAGERDFNIAGDMMFNARKDAERAGMLPSTTGEFWKHDQHPHKYPDQLNRGGIASLV